MSYVFYKPVCLFVCYGLKLEVFNESRMVLFGEENITLTDISDLSSVKSPVSQYVE